MAKFQKIITQQKPRTC